MTTRAIHLEVIESMTASCFINSLCRFFAIRGSAKILRSDAYLSDIQCCWQFNPPHSSHMAGSWDRMIGISRHILDAMLLKHKVSAIVNAQPLTAVSTDSEQPLILTPALLLTQKVGAPPVPPGQFEEHDLCRAQWRHVQCLANVFWGSKWRTAKPNLQNGDVVLLKDAQEKRNYWLVGLITKTFPCEQRFFLRPVTEVTFLVSKDTD
ncbi:hypothetical protein IRJ41_002008 [Triplophysa rosa]|uniref:DUF5641 domain-containing protein n=1 Tax=Triplophysa rosa TaxID=992332 RepID=A0A9W7X1Z5_TRIRA|nr:hypothetical protein IRJ41_002008 [Triplophysa rosa]